MASSDQDNDGSYVGFDLSTQKSSDLQTVDTTTQEQRRYRLQQAFKALPYDLRDADTNPTLKYLKFVLNKLESEECNESQATEESVEDVEIFLAKVPTVGHSISLVTDIESEVQTHDVSEAPITEHITSNDVVNFLERVPDIEAAVETHHVSEAASTENKTLEHLVNLLERVPDIEVAIKKHNVNEASSTENINLNDLVNLLENVIDIEAAVETHHVSEAASTENKTLEHLVNLLERVPDIEVAIKKPNVNEASSTENINLNDLINLLEKVIDIEATIETHHVSEAPLTKNITSNDLVNLHERVPDIANEAAVEIPHPSVPPSIDSLSPSGLINILETYQAAIHSKIEKLEPEAARDFDAEDDDNDDNYIHEEEQCNIEFDDVNVRLDKLDKAILELINKRHELERRYVSSYESERKEARLDNEELQTLATHHMDTIISQRLAAIGDMQKVRMRALTMFIDKVQKIEETAVSQGICDDGDLLSNFISMHIEEEEEEEEMLETNPSYTIDSQPDQIEENENNSDINSNSTINDSLDIALMNMPESAMRQLLEVPSIPALQSLSHGFDRDTSESSEDQQQEILERDPYTIPCISTTNQNEMNGNENNISSNDPLSDEEEGVSLNTQRPVEMPLLQDWVSIGPNGTKVLRSVLDSIQWDQLRAASITRKILAVVFGRDLLARASLTGQPSSTIVNCIMPQKMKLDEHKVADIIYFMTSNVNVTSRQLKAVQLGPKLEVIATAEVKFDTDLPEFRTTGGVNAGTNKNEFHVQPVMWVKAMDIVLDRLIMAGADLSTVAALSGSAQQHGSLYWSRHGIAALRKLDPDRFLHAQIDDSAFVVNRTPIWMDGSTSKQCLEMETAIGGHQEMVSISGSKCYPRFTGPQIRKIYQQRTHAFEDAQRISLVSSFLASIFLGDVAPIDYSDASGMNLLDIRTKNWSKACLNSCAPDLEERLGEPVDTLTVLGNVCDYFVQRFGFPEECKVIACTGDNPSALSGMLVDENWLSISLGTSDTIMMNLEEPPKLEEGHVLCHPTDAKSFMGLLCFRNGSLVRDGINKSEAQGSWDKFNELLESTPRGNYGNMAVHFNEIEIIPKAKGTLRWSKDINVASPDAAKGVTKFNSAQTEIRALIEGQMLHHRAIAEDMGFHFGEHTKIIATGGASKNKAILQTISDVFNAPVYVQNDSEAALMGAAYRSKYALYLHKNDEKSKAADNHDESKSPVDSYHDYILNFVPNHLQLISNPSRDSEQIYRPMLQRYRDMARILETVN